MCEGCANSVKKLLESRVSDSNSNIYVLPISIFPFVAMTKQYVIK